MDADPIGAAGTLRVHGSLCLAEAAEALIGEARDIAARLRCQPLLDRAAGLMPARPPVTGLGRD